MIHGSFLRVAVAGAIVLTSCQRADDTVEPRALDRAELLGTAGSMGSTLSAVASRQRAFLQALAGQQGVPTDFMSSNFTYRDRMNPADSIGRAPGGAPAIGMDYFRALSDRVPPIYARADSMEIFQQRSGQVVVITRHPDVLPTVTRWERQGSEWMATSFVINVDEEALANFNSSRT